MQKTLVAVLCAFTLTASAHQSVSDPHIFDLGMDSLIVGRPDPDKPGYGYLSEIIRRDPVQQQAGVTLWSGFPEWAFKSDQGVVLIFTPFYHKVGEAMMQKIHTVEDLDKVNNWTAGAVHGIMGIVAPGVIGWGGTNFIEAFGMEGAPVSFYFQNWDNGGVDANELFLTDAALNYGLRLGFVTQPSEPRPTENVPDDGATGWLVIIFGLAAVWFSLIVNRERRLRKVEATDYLSEVHGFSR